LTSESAVGKPPMTHGLASVLVALALLTGLVLGSLGKIGLHPSRAIPAPETRNQQIGRQYYEALDVLMLTGDDHELRLLLGDEFRDHQSSTNAAVDVEHLIAEYQSLRNVVPGSRYVVEDLVSAGDLVIATLRLRLDEQPEFAGIEIALNHQRSLQEILRIRDGFVVERWSDSSIPPRLMTIATLGEIAFTGVPELQRWQFDSHAFDTIRAHSDVILIVEQGELVVEPDSLSGKPPAVYGSIHDTPMENDPEPILERHRVERGDILHIPNRSVVKFWNYSGESASILTIAGHSSGRNGPQFDDGAEGVRRQLLARGFSLGSAIPAFAVSVGHVELSPGSEFVHKSILDGGQFVIVTDGLLTATARDGLIWTADSNSIITSNEQQRLLAGKGAAVADGSEVSFVASRTLETTFLTVTFIPVNGARQQ
jgi:predicted ester cyclase